jgi:hypothetical protein
VKNRFGKLWKVPVGVNGAANVAALDCLLKHGKIDRAAQRFMMEAMGVTIEPEAPSQLAGGKISSGQHISIPTFSPKSWTANAGFWLFAAVLVTVLLFGLLAFAGKWPVSQPTTGGTVTQPTQPTTPVVTVPVNPGRDHLDIEVIDKGGRLQ